MAKVTIIIEDTVDGNVRTIMHPSAEELMKEIAQKDGKNVAPSKLYAIRAATAIIKLGQQNPDTQRIITSLPRIGG